MRRIGLTILLVLAVAWPGPSHAQVRVTTTQELVAAVREANPGTLIELAAGTYKLDAPLDLPGGITLKGAGIDKTILTHTDDRNVSTKALPDPEMKLEGLDTSAYLIRIQRHTADVTIAHLTLHAPRLHGAIFAWFHTGLHLHHLKINQTMWCGIRTFGMKQAKIHDCELIDAGGRWAKGEPGIKGGITGGAIFAVWMSDCEIFNNRFTRKRKAPELEFYGIKVRQARRCRIHHNTLMANFSMEFPFEHDEDVEIDHNVCFGTISIPRRDGGKIPKSGRTFHIHHNLFKDSYSIEFTRNGIEISHNLFDFDVNKDHGNLISGFNRTTGNGPCLFHNNLIRNPGRGVIWINEIYNNLEVRNNHIITNKTITPRKDGLFGFNPKCDFKTITIKDNIIECNDIPRPLLRAKESYQANIENNTLVNVADADQLKNPKADRPVGLLEPLQFTCGVNDEYTVNGWEVRPTKQ